MSDPKFDQIRHLVQKVEEELVQMYEDERMSFEDDLPDDIRSHLHRLACSVKDYTFWVRRRPQEDDLSQSEDDQMYYCLEVETGCGAWGVTAREAVDNYFRDDILDHRRVPHVEGT